MTGLPPATSPLENVSCGSPRSRGATPAVVPLFNLGRPRHFSRCGCKDPPLHFSGTREHGTQRPTGPSGAGEGPRAPREADAKTELAILQSGGRSPRNLRLRLPSFALLKIIRVNPGFTQIPSEYPDTELSERCLGSESCNIKY